MSNSFDAIEPRTTSFANREEVERLTDEEALRVVASAREMLIATLEGQRHHNHMLDDCGDYLAAATDNWNFLFHAYWDNDGGADFVPLVKQWLLSDMNDGPYPWGGSDGEVRYLLVPFMDPYDD